MQSEQDYAGGCRVALQKNIQSAASCEENVERKYVELAVSSFTSVVASAVVVTTRRSGRYVACISSRHEVPAPLEFLDAKCIIEILM
jgi:hypothetical protein